MIHVGQRILVIDNTGAKFAKCLRVYKNQKFAKLGELIYVSIKKVIPNKKVKKGEKYQGVVIRLRGQMIRNTISYYLSCTTDAIILLKKKSTTDLLGTRILGPTMQEFLPPKPKKAVVGGVRSSKKQFSKISYKKIYSLAPFKI